MKIENDEIDSFSESAFNLLIAAYVILMSILTLEFANVAPGY